MEAASDTASSQGDAPVLWRRALALYDAVFLPRVKARWVATRGATMQDLVRARLLVVLVVYQFAGVLLFALSSTGHSATSWVLRGISLAAFFSLAVAVRFIEEPTKASYAMIVLMLLNSWVLVWWGSGSVTLTANNTQLTPLIFALLGGIKVGIFGMVQGVLFVVMVWVLDQNNWYTFPAQIPDDQRIQYFGLRAVYLTVFATVLALNYAFVHTSKVRELKRMNVQLARAAKEAKEAADLKSTFIATMSHEIRTPLNGIIGMAQVLSHSNLDRDQRAELQMLQNCGESLLAIINDILDVAKIQANKVELESTPMRLQEIVERTFAMLSTKANERRVQLTHDLLDIHGFTDVYGDPTRLQQVLVNIISNAVKFTPPRGEVSLRVTAIPEPHIQGDEEGENYHRVTFAVTDTGMGIPEDRQKAIFEAFTQNDASTTRQHGGTGLGLTICRSLVRLMGGDVTVQSVLGSGSTFTFDVRLRGNSKLQSMVKASPPTRVLRRVLYLDDCASHAHVISRYLDALGCQSTHVTDAKSALDAVNKRGAMWDWVVVNLDTYDANTDMAALSFVLYVKELEVRNLKRTRLMLLRNQWADNTTTDSSLKLRSMLQKHSESVVVLPKPILYETFVEVMVNLQTPTPSAHIPNGELSMGGRQSSNTSQPEHAQTSPQAQAKKDPINNNSNSNATSRASRTGIATISGASISAPAGPGGFAAQAMVTPDEAQLRTPAMKEDSDSLFGSSYSSSDDEGHLDLRARQRVAPAQQQPADPSLSQSVPNRPTPGAGVGTGAPVNSRGRSGSNDQQSQRQRSAGSSLDVTAPMVAGTSAASEFGLASSAAGRGAAPAQSSSPPAATSGSGVRSAAGLSPPMSSMTAPNGLNVSGAGGSSAGAAAAGPGSRLRCLLVEDNPTNQQVVTRMLKIMGYTCDVAGDGREAINRCAERVLKPDTMYHLILMDLHMPVVGGAEAAMNIRGLVAAGGLSRHAVRIIAVSADAQESTREATRSEFDGFLAKPFLMDDLRTVLEQAVKIP